MHARLEGLLAIGHYYLCLFTVSELSVYQRAPEDKDRALSMSSLSLIFFNGPRWVCVCDKMNAVLRCAFLCRGNNDKQSYYGRLRPSKLHQSANWGRGEINVIYSVALNRTSFNMLYLMFIKISQKKFNRPFHCIMPVRRKSWSVKE